MLPSEIHTISRRRFRKYLISILHFSGGMLDNFLEKCERTLEKMQYMIDRNLSIELRTTFRKSRGNFTKDVLKN